jgi:hypothetical protein
MRVVSPKYCFVDGYELYCRGNKVLNELYSTTTTTVLTSRYEYVVLGGPTPVQCMY